MIPAFVAKVDADGRLVFKDNKAFTRYLTAAFFTYGETDVFVTVQRAPKLRSTNQNRYYHGIIVKLVADHLGYTPMDTHTLIKTVFQIESTAKMESAAFEKFLEDIRIWAQTELELRLPLPNEVDLAS